MSEQQKSKGKPTKPKVEVLKTTPEQLRMIGQRLKQSSDKALKEVERERDEAKAELAEVKKSLDERIKTAPPEYQEELAQLRTKVDQLEAELKTPKGKSEEDKPKEPGSTYAFPFNLYRKD